MDRLRAALEVSARTNGIGAARRAIAAMNGLSESPGESLSRLRMKEYGFPDPVLQQVLRVGSQFLARVDFYWRRWRLVGEFDGMGKYETGQTLAQEKVREDDLRDRGSRSSGGHGKTSGNSTGFANDSIVLARGPSADDESAGGVPTEHSIAHLYSWATE